jgi:GT2 family glycosyltransferase
MIEIVTATRSDAATFKTDTMLGKSRQRLRYNPTIGWRIAVSNSAGLPKVYNAAIDDANEHDIVVFMHDDVWIDDYFFGQRIVEGLKSFDVIGVAGNRRRASLQKCWFSASPTDFAFDTGSLSGILAQMIDGSSQVTTFGAVPAPCELLDGVFLAARKSKLLEAGVRFDERFDFHFYDLDFCRSARAAGLRLGTWPIAISHHSGSVFGGPAWAQQKDLYFDKWGD